MERAVINKPKNIIGENLRYERKFIFEKTYLDDLVQDVLSNSYCFSEVFHRRGVNNIYFDDNNFNFYHQNVSGTGKREKCRIRWYGDELSKIDNPTFEIKKKFGEVGDKISYKLRDYSTTLDLIAIDDFEYLVYENANTRAQSVISKFQQLNPTLYNSYERRYFLSFCERFRITLDYNMVFYNPNTKNYLSSMREIDQNEIILELKYKMEHDKESRNLTQQFKTRMTKNSKYVRGIELVY